MAHNYFALDTNVMNRFEFEQFKDRVDSNDDNISQNEWFRFSKTCLELFYGKPVDRDLIKIDKHRTTRQQTQMFEQLHNYAINACAINATPNFNDLTHKLIYNSKVAVALLHFLLSETPVFTEGVFDETVVFAGDDLKAFVDAASKLKNPIATQLDITIRKDIVENPVQQLGIFVNRLGLSVKKKDSYTSQGRKIYEYCLDPTPLQEMKERVEFRSNSKNIGWSYIDKTYGFTYTEDQFETFYGS